MIDVNEISCCEVCGCKELSPVLNLGTQPLCDDLVPINDTRICKEYPIEILFCKKCRTAHQRYQISKKILFPPSYHYRAKHTADVLDGMEQLVTACEQIFGSLKGLNVLDIGCNDGSLLSFFRKKGANCFGFEPTDAYQDAVKIGHKIINDYFDIQSSENFIRQFGQPDIITFTNVFAHIENISEVLAALKILSHDHTKIVIENHYLGSILSGCQFDTFYHEHPRSYSFTSFTYIAKTLAMEIQKVEFPKRYGGNIRIFLTKENINKLNNFGDIVSLEQTFYQDFIHLSESIEKWKLKKKKILAKEVEKFGKLPGKAFPGRAAIPVKLLELTENSINAVYEKPASNKVGFYVPGTRIPILSDDNLVDTPVLINFAWHISSEIKAYLLSKGYKGKIIDIISNDDFL
jgi:hypothetical protein